MEYLWFIIIFLIILTFILFFLFLSQCRKNKNYKLKLSHYESKEYSFGVFISYLRLLLSDTNPLDELVRYYHLSKVSDKYQETLGPELVKKFLKYLGSKWGLSEIGPYYTLVPYNPRIHSSSDTIRKDEKVLVIYPGWEIKGQLLKRAIVRKTRS